MILANRVAASISSRLGEMPPTSFRMHVTGIYWNIKAQIGQDSAHPVVSRGLPHDLRAVFIR